MDPRCSHHLQALLAGEWLEPLCDDGALCTLYQPGDVAEVITASPSCDTLSDAGAWLPSLFPACFPDQPYPVPKGLGHPHKSSSSSWCLEAVLALLGSTVLLLFEDVCFPDTSALATWLKPCRVPHREIREVRWPKPELQGYSGTRHGGRTHQSAVSLSSHPDITHLHWAAEHLLSTPNFYFTCVLP